MKRDVHAVCLAARGFRVPWYAKSAALQVAPYALSPIDLIPDFYLWLITLRPGDSPAWHLAGHSPGAV